MTLKDVDVCKSCTQVYAFFPLLVCTIYANRTAMSDRQAGTVEKFDWLIVSTLGNGMLVD